MAEKAEARMKPMNRALAYVDANLCAQECTSFYGYGDGCTATVVVSASKTF